VTQEELIQYEGTLHKTFSKLLFAQGEYAKALDKLKQGIYMDCMQHGPESIITSISYY